MLQDVHFFRIDEMIGLRTSHRLVPSGGPVRAVLEIIGGSARKLGIAPGDRVASPIFSGH